MRVVLYSHNYVPITIVDVDLSLIEYFKLHRFYRLLVREPYEVSRDYSNVVMDRAKELTIGCKPIRYDDSSSNRDWIFYLPIEADSDYVMGIYNEPARDEVYYKNHDQFKLRDIFIRSLSAKYSF